MLVSSSPVDGPYTVQLAGADGRILAHASARSTLRLLTTPRGLAAWVVVGVLSLDFPPCPW